MYRPAEESVVKESVGWAYLLFKVVRRMCIGTYAAVLFLCTDYVVTLLMCIDYLGCKALG